MIKNKVLIIRKDTSFDKRWSLVKPFDFGINEDRNFKEIKTQDVINLITFCDTVNLILKEPCLSSQIIEEIKWAEKYISLNITVKDKATLDYYKNLKFKSSKVDSSIDFNYIAIEGKQNGYFYINDGYIATDNVPNDLFFKEKKTVCDFVFLKDVKQAIIVDPFFEQKYQELICEFNKKKIKTNYLIDAKLFNEKMSRSFLEKSIKIFIGNINGEGVILQQNDGKILLLNYLDEGSISRVFVRDTNFLFNEVYETLNVSNNIDTKDIGKNVYSCINGQIKLLDIQDTKIIDIDVEIPSMEDFINESFDSKIALKYNDYSSEVKTVEYRFCLIPPVFNNSYKESSIYNDIYKIERELSALCNLEWQSVIEEYRKFLISDFGLQSFLDYAEKFIGIFSYCLQEKNFKNYYTNTKQAYEIFSKTNENLLEIFKSMFLSINEKATNTKFDKFDAEIAGYRQTIEEKKDLVSKGIDVLSNKRRIEILSSKINDLLIMKERFEDNASSRSDTVASDYIKLCNDILEGNIIQAVENSIGDIIKPKEETRMEKLELFTKKYLLELKRTLVLGVDILKRAIEVKIPTDYIVYEKNKQKYIVIDNIDEFSNTESIRKEFDLKCLCRR